MNIIFGMTQTFYELKLWKYGKHVNYGVKKLLFVFWGILFLLDCRCHLPLLLYRPTAC